MLKKQLRRKKIQSSIRKKIRNYVENRKAVQELSALSDHALSDIGLSRSQIRQAVLGR